MDPRDAVRGFRRGAGVLLVLAVLTVALAVVLSLNWWFTRPGSLDGAPLRPWVYAPAEVVLVAGPVGVGSACGGGAA